VAVLNKNSQNDLAYMPVATKQRDIGAGHLLHMRPTFIRSLRSMLHCWNSVIPTLFSLNLALMQELLPVICSIVGDVVFVFQQDNALSCLPAR